MGQWLVGMRWQDPRSIGGVLKVLGPDLVAGASDDDPANIATYSVAGASLDYTTLWTALVTLPMMVAVQFICAKVGLVTGRGLSGVVFGDCVNLDSVGSGSS